MSSNSKLIVVLLFSLGVTSVLPTLWGDFLFDDGEAIVKNADVTAPGWTNATDIFMHDFWGADITHKLSHKSYRPLTTLTYRMNWISWGQNAYPFHLINLIIHGLNCALVFILIKKCIQCKNAQPKSSRSSKGGKSSCKKCELLAFWGSVLFSVHPCHVEPLGAIVGRADLLAAFVFLGAFCIGMDKKEISSYWRAAFIAFASVLGSLFKETAISLSILAIFLDLHSKRQRKVLGSQLKAQIPKYALILGISASFVLWRLWLQDGSPVFQWYDNPHAFMESIPARIVNIVYIWVLNVLILMFPLYLCYDWSMGCVPLIESVYDIRFLIVSLFVVACARVAFLTLRKRLIMIPALIFATTFLPSSNLLFTVGFVLAERNLYLPSIGFCLFIAYVFNRVKRKRLLMIVVGAFYMRSIQRSMDWMSQGSLFISALSVCPNNAKVHYNLGTLYADRNAYELAENSYKSAISLRPDGYYQAMNNLGNLLRLNNRVQEAEKWLRTAVKIKPDFAAAWMNLGIVLSNKNQTEALTCYKNALKFRKSYPDCEYNLGNLYLDMGYNEEALDAWNRATALKPNHAQAWINSVILLEQEERLKDAKNIAVKALKYVPKEDTLHFILGNILGKLSEFKSAKVSFETAIKIRKERQDNIPPKYFSNLGVLYHRWGKTEKAIKAYQQALKIEPHSKSTRDNLEMLMKALKKEKSSKTGKA